MIFKSTAEDRQLFKESGRITTDDLESYEGRKMIRATGLIHHKGFLYAYHQCSKCNGFRINTARLECDRCIG